ncbi:hypothetical protein CFK37_03855 [Virgibacillus phasianinus]|uniref:Uncharacterized protein n=1 Tax=Virgibacillus phasianinus TaxID=2017483 RepID=A0A220U091_9BACI|nr:hypothetical protein [Virgibacillus phasianinus]ASK61366.1 hypothetical protein CFK37_03855 [Virgibacillus phasianinus]
MKKMKDTLLTKIIPDKPFQAFKTRLQKVIAYSEKRIETLELSDEQLKQLYDGILPFIETSIYAEMEYVMVAIRTTYDVVIQRFAGEIEQSFRKNQVAKERNKQNNQQNGIQALGGHKSFSMNKKTSESESVNESSKDTEIQGFVRSRLETYMANEESFAQFVTHVTTNFQSLQKQRIDVLMIKNDTYQSFEMRLFDEGFISMHGFKAVYELHNQLIETFYTRFDDLLFAGDVLNTDGKINEQVLVPVLKQFQKKLTSRGVGHEQAECL